MEREVILEQEIDQSDVSRINHAEVLSNWESDKEVSQRSNFQHGSVKGLLASSFNTYLLAKKLTPALVSVDVIFPCGTQRVVPDIAITFKRFTAYERLGFFMGVPEIIVEIIDSASYLEDTVYKHLLYASQSVPEYWLIFPEVELILVYRLMNSQYKLIAHAIQKGAVSSAVLPDFHLDLKSVFLDYT